MCDNAYDIEVAWRYVDGVNRALNRADFYADDYPPPPDAVWEEC